MKIEKVAIGNFQCFGPDVCSIELEPNSTALIGANGSGKTAFFEALMRMFGVTAAERAIRKSDFHVPAEAEELQAGATLSIEVILSFPELEGPDPDRTAGDAIPEFFNQMTASEPGEPPKVRLRLQATWLDDGTPDGTVDEDLRWVTTLGAEYDWDNCRRVQAVERGSIQLVYLPAMRRAKEPVTSLLRGRLWRAARWSQEFREATGTASATIQRGFQNEEPTRQLLERLAARWAQVHDADTDAVPKLQLVDQRFHELIRKADFLFHPDEAGQDRALNDLSDGQQSLFYLSLTAAMLEVERDAFESEPEGAAFEPEKLRRTHLTILAIEEPENSLSPFFLSRVVAQTREIGALDTAQVVLSSHSAALLGRIDPEEVRHFHLKRQTRRSTVRRLAIPDDDVAAAKYIRLAVRAYPELYFARFVILAEGDSEQLLLPRLAESMNVPLDPSFVPVVPLGGRYCGHFWLLLEDLEIPYATLLDLDLGRANGGADNVRRAFNMLGELGRDFNNNPTVNDGRVNLADLANLSDEDLLVRYDSNYWLQALEAEGVYFSLPLDLDFAMLHAFPDAYTRLPAGARGPDTGDQALDRAKAATLKSGGDADLYADGCDQTFRWYPYLFLRRSKPEGHLIAVSQIDTEKLAVDAPSSLRRMIEHVRETLQL